MPKMPDDLPENDRGARQFSWLAYWPFQPWIGTPDLSVGRGYSLWRMGATLLLLALLAAPAARACSTYYEPGETPATAYADVARAPLIVEARVIRPLADGYVEFTVKRALRGTAEGRIRVSGRYFADLRTYRGWLGECFHDVYQAGATYLLLLSPDGKGGYSPDASPLQFEPGRTSLRRAWVEVAAEIVRIEDTLPPDQRMAAIRAALAQVQHPKASDAEKFKARRLSEQLDTIQTTQPTSYLIWLHGELEAGRIPDGLRWNPWVEDWTVTSDDGTVSRPHVYTAPEYRIAVLWALSRPGHADAAEFFAGLAARNDDPAGLFFAITHMAWHDRRGDAARLLATRIMTVSLAEASNHMSMVGSAMSGRTRVDEEPAWHRDPVLRDTWPDLAWRFQAYLGSYAGPTFFRDIAPYLQVTDPVAEPDKALWLVSEVTDHPLLAWAEQRLRDPANRAEWDRRYKGWEENEVQLPLRLLTERSQGDILLTELFCRDEKSRAGVIEAFRRELTFLTGSLYLRMLATPGLSEEERQGLLLAGAAAATRNGFKNDELYIALVKGTAPKAEPLACPTRKEG